LPLALPAVLTKVPAGQDVHAVHVVWLLVAVKVPAAHAWQIWSKVDDP
jgi:hypothetical protein